MASNTKGALLRCPRCGGRLEYVADEMAEQAVGGDTVVVPFYGCSNCEYCASPEAHAAVPALVFERLFRTPSGHVLYAVTRVEDGYAIVRLAAATLAMEPPMVVRRYSKRRQQGAYTAAERMAKEDR